MHSRSSDTASAAPSQGDPLAAVITLLRPQTVLSKVISGAGDWSVRYDEHEHPGFCIMLEGTCFLDVEGVGATELHAGDFVLLPSGPSFVMASDLRLKPTLLRPSNPRELRHGEASGKPSMRQLGGYFRFDRANAQLLTRWLPAMVHIRGAEPGAARLHRVVAMIAEEAMGREPGRDLILERLVEIMLVEALRFRPAAAAKPERGLLAGLADAGLARSLHQVHRDVAHRWTVAELARAAGMSRAVFAERFNRTVGMPPMQYVLEWRMAIAKDALRRERPPLAELADRIGYQSASAFSTAFARLTGSPPSAFAKG